MACNFNIENYASKCADASGVATVSLIPRDNITGITIGSDGRVESFTYAETFDKWARFEVVDGKGNINMQNTLDPKKSIYFNAYTLTFNLDSFNANIIKSGAKLNSNFLAAVKLNNGLIYLLGYNKGKYNDMKITSITSTTGAAMGDASETVITMVYKTDEYALEMVPEASDSVGPITDTDYTTVHPQEIA